MARPILVLLLALAASSRAAEPGPSFNKVVIVVFENTAARAALAQPFFASLAKKGARLAEYYAITHPSQPNYIAMIAGDALGVASNRNATLEETSLVDLLERAGKTWKAYAEGYPGNCYLKARRRKYVRKHVPFLSFKSVQEDAERCAGVVEASQFWTDLRAGKLPDYSMYVPDLSNSGHDTDIRYADRWFAEAFGPMVDDPELMKGLLLVVTFDEDDGKAGNHILTILLGEGVKPGWVSANRYDHYSLLRTIEDRLGLETLGRNDATATPISGVWK